ncbi:MAG: hypothetical protein RIM33_15840 [Alphaproteobacteria bacterium]
MIDFFNLVKIINTGDADFKENVILAFVVIYFLFTVLNILMVSSFVVHMDKANFGGAIGKVDRSGASRNQKRGLLYLFWMFLFIFVILIAFRILNADEMIQISRTGGRQFSVIELSSYVLVYWYMFSFFNVCCVIFIYISYLLYRVRFVLGGGDSKANFEG